MLWLGLHFSSLPLEIHARGAPQDGPVAVVAAGSGAAVAACNHRARVRGVREGMPLSAACALAADLRAIARDENAERDAVSRIAGWALQYTPVVSLAGAAVLLLEVEGSIKLFGGLDALFSRLLGGLKEIGFEPAAACAPTPRAAEIFARGGLALRVRHGDALRAALEPLPVGLLGHDAATVAKLGGFGARTIGDCLRLPRAGLARRLGPAFVADLDRALGALPDPRQPFVPPARFHADLPLPAPVDDAQALLFAARRLLAELCGRLAAAGLGMQSLHLRISHDHIPPTAAHIELVAAQRDPAHLATVLRERLQRVMLPQPATGLALTVERHAPLAAGSLSFLPDGNRHAAAASKLVERLRARLGGDAVAGIAAVPDHRPERAWRACEPGDAPLPPGTRVAARRPLFLVHEPRPIAEIRSVPHYGGPLALVAGPERIEAGWWDGAPVARDYFVARSPADALLWIYRERDAAGRWYLHGYFS